jgi:signal peptidase I
VDEDGRPEDGRLIDFPHDSDKGPQKDDHTFEAKVVGDDEYFALGDNRANSSDSRSFGGIEEELIVGKAFVLVWPPTRFTGL